MTQKALPHATTQARLLLVVPSLGGGGAERVVSVLANTWAERGRTVAIMTLGTAAEDFFPLHPSVRRIRLAVQPPLIRRLGGIARNIARVIAMRGELRRYRPTVVISFIDKCNVLAVGATRSLDVRTVVSERTDPARHELGPIWRILRSIAYRCADTVVVQSDAVGAWLSDHTATKRGAIAVIPNPALMPAVPVAARRAAAVDARRGGTVLAVGRLSQEKGFDLLLQAFAMVRASHPGWRLRLVGDGPERDALSALAARLGIADEIDMMPPTKDLPSVYLGAEIFALPSRYEGFPNALLEAMAHGLPAISFAGSGGPRDIIRHEVDGLLVPHGDLEALARALDRLMADRAARARLAARAPDVIKRFSIEEVMRRWDEIAEGALGVAEPASRRFDFGKNWAKFLPEIDAQRVEAAGESLRRTLGAQTLNRSYFLDVGSGSGLFSLAARQCGARVHSFDRDLDSVRCTLALKREYRGGDDEWQIEAGDVLNRSYLQSLPRFDVVYAWGVLHHTGAMWQAIDNLLPVVKAGGRIVMAIYNAQGARSRYWAALKAFYNKAPKTACAVILVLAFMRLWGPTMLRDILRGRAGQTWRNYSRERGMSPWRDVIDWVGGFPFDVATPEEVVCFVAARGFAVERVRTCGRGHGCNEFTFRRTAPS